jgi:hypothetical protein
VSILELVASRTLPDQWREDDIAGAHDEHASRIREVGNVVGDIETLMREAMNSGIHPTRLEIAALRTIANQYQIVGMLVAGKILENELKRLGESK